MPVEIQADQRLLREFAIFKPGSSEGDIIGIPLTSSVIKGVRGFRLVNDRGHAMLCTVPIQDLDFIPVLKINATIAPLTGHQEFYMQAEIPVLLFRYNISRTVQAAF